MISTIAIIIIVVYLFLIGIFIYGFDMVNDFELQDLEPKTQFSIVIPFRNEADNLPQLLDSISRLNYPKNLFEVILVDDASSDNSVGLIRDFISKKSLASNSNLLSEQNQNGIKVIQNIRVSNAPKKDAINSAITISKYKWIITTDADCILPTYWLDVFDEYIQTTDSDCIAAPVTYNVQQTFFDRFQTLDILSLQGTTIGSFGIRKPFLCNGANFAYRKSVFKALEGFDGNSEIASGDDVFLLQKFIEKDAKKVRYLKSQKVIVTTRPALNFQELIQQRLRWASKTSKSSNSFSKLVGLLVVLANLFCISIIPLVLFNLLMLKTALALCVIKFSIDFLLLYKASRFFKQENVLFSYLFSSLLYPIFSIYIVVLSLFKSYKWKGRTFRR